MGKESRRVGFPRTISRAVLARRPGWLHFFREFEAFFRHLKLSHGGTVYQEDLIAMIR